MSIPETSPVSANFTGSLTARFRAPPYLPPKNLKAIGSSVTPFSVTVAVPARPASVSEPSAAASAFIAMVRCSGTAAGERARLSLAPAEPDPRPAPPANCPANASRASSLSEPVCSESSPTGPERFAISPLIDACMSSARSVAVLMVIPGPCGTSSTSARSVRPALTNSTSLSTISSMETISTGRSAAASAEPG